MKKHPKSTPNSIRKSRRLTVIVVAAVVLLGLGAATAISRQKTEANTISAAKPIGQNYITVKVGGQDVQVDSQTGKIKPLTPQEAEKMAQGLKELLNQSTEGLVQVHHPDGSVSVDLQDRFHNVTVARVEEDGNVVTSCVDNPQAAAAFFGIDPQLLEDGTNSGNPTTQSPARTLNR